MCFYSFFILSGQQGYIYWTFEVWRENFSFSLFFIWWSFFACMAFELSELPVRAMNCPPASCELPNIDSECFVTLKVNFSQKVNFGVDFKILYCELRNFWTLNFCFVCFYIVNNRKRIKRAKLTFYDVLCKKVNPLL